MNKEVITEIIMGLRGKLKNKSPRDIIWSYPIPIPILRKFINLINEQDLWREISVFQRLDKRFIREFADYLDWDEICIHQKFSVDFLREMEKHLDVKAWHSICSHQRLNDKFIEEFKDKIDWKILVKYQILSERIVEKNLDRISWNLLSLYQNMSEKFYKKHLNEYKNNHTVIDCLLNHKPYFSCKFRETLENEMLKFKGFFY